jgi:protein-S-isoprenylcysteine O-methyltransferase Ste14
MTPRSEPRTDAPADAGNMLPKRRGRRLAVERVFVRLVATAGIIGVGVALGAILTSNKVDGWITGLVIALVSVILAAMLWSSRQL